VATYLQAQINVADLVALLVALIPTTIGALLSAIGIAAIDRTMQFNVLAMSGNAVEAAGDVQTLLLDETGTITVGDRQANDFIAVSGREQKDLIQAAFLASYFDTTPEGRSALSTSAARGAQPVSGLEQAQGLDFSAQTRMSGIHLPGGKTIRKGAVSAVVRHVVDEFHCSAPVDLQAIADHFQ
jgi:K+-transporting ATPase ATPase B chain